MIWLRIAEMLDLNLNWAIETFCCLFSLLLWFFATRRQSSADTQVCDLSVSAFFILFGVCVCVRKKVVICVCVLFFILVCVCIFVGDFHFKRICVCVCVCLWVFFHVRHRRRQGATRVSADIHVCVRGNLRGGILLVQKSFWRSSFSRPGFYFESGPKSHFRNKFITWEWTQIRTIEKWTKITFWHVIINCE